MKTVYRPDQEHGEEDVHDEDDGDEDSPAEVEGSGEGDFLQLGLFGSFQIVLDPGRETTGTRIFLY